MRVLQLTSLFPTPSRPNFGIFVARSTQALARQPGVEVEVIAPVARPPWPLSLLAHYRTTAEPGVDRLDETIMVHRPSFTTLPRIARFDAAAMARAALPIARQVARERGIDVITAGFFHPDAAAAATVARHLGLPFTATARGSDIMFWRRRPPILAQMLDAAHRAERIFAVSASLAEHMTKLGFPAKKIVVRYTGLDTSRFNAAGRDEARRRLDIGPGPALLTVGALIPLKGHAILLEALPTLRERLPALRWFVAGAGSELAALQRRARELGVDEAVTFLGGLAHDDVPAWLKAADLMVLPTEREGLANVWVEALGCGTRVVTTDIPSAREAVERAEDGALVKREPAALAAAIEALLDQPHDPARLAARTHARFNWDDHGAALAAQLRAVAGLSDSGE